MRKEVNFHPLVRHKAICSSLARTTLRDFKLVFYYFNFFVDFHIFLDFTLLMCMERVVAGNGHATISSFSLKDYQVDRDRGQTSLIIQQIVATLDLKHRKQEAQSLRRQSLHRLSVSGTDRQPDGWSVLQHLLIPREVG